MNQQVINLTQKFSLFNEQWTPKIIAQMNDYHFKLARFEGEFTWHDHKETDEVFLVVDGKMGIQFRDKTVHLNEGDLFVVPKGVEHKPFAESECKVLLVEPAGTVNTGEAGGELTADNGTWI